jgi:hypothetical protein
MRTAFRTSPHRARGLRLAAAVLPLPALMMPGTVHAGDRVMVAICSGGGAREITIPARDAPPPRPDDRQGCAHFTCPRERGFGNPVDDDED